MILMLSIDYYFNKYINSFGLCNEDAECFLRDNSVSQYYLNKLKCSPSNVNINIPTIRSKSPAQILSYAENKFHILTLYLIHFPKLYPPSNVPLPEDERALPGNLQSRKMLLLPPPKM
jgi:hypothetical protein